MSEGGREGGREGDENSELETHIQEPFIRESKGAEICTYTTDKASDTPVTATTAFKWPTIKTERSLHEKASCNLAIDKTERIPQKDH